jgi:hypothetical protein
MQCELCRNRSKKRLCPDCANMIARVETAWRSLDMARRGMLIWRAMKNTVAGIGENRGHVVRCKTAAVQDNSGPAGGN